MNIQVLIFRGWVDPRAHGTVWCPVKNSHWPGIDPGTLRLVAQCLNHYANPAPPPTMGTGIKAAGTRRWQPSPLLAPTLWMNTSSSSLCLLGMSIWQPLISDCKTVQILRSKIRIKKKSYQNIWIPQPRCSLFVNLLDIFPGILCLYCIVDMAVWQLNTVVLDLEKELNFGTSRDYA